MRATALALAAAALAGCALRGAPEEGPPQSSAVAAPADDAAERRVAADLVEVLARVEAVAPARAPLVRVTAQSGEPAFARALSAALEGTGYALADGDAGDASGPALPVGYVVQRGAGDGGERTATYTVALGDVQARRSWSLGAGTDGAADGAADWEPASPLYVRGADVATIAPAAPASGAGSGAATDADRPAAVEIASVSTPVARRVPPGAAAPAGAGDASPDASAASRIAIDPATGRPVYGGLTREALGGAPLPTERNVMDLGGSNFADLFVDYADVAERILVFGNDSERLGADNKAIVAAVAEDFDAARDVFSIVGCSLGPTSLPNGNERLALGRANRVKEELVAAGVPSERIVDEGCWAGDSSARFPSRGVVLTHKRRG